MKPSLPSDLKAQNRATIYNLLKTQSSLSRADLARSSGISAPTVLKIIDYFLGLGLVEEGGEGGPGGDGRDGLGAVGRRPLPLAWKPQAAYALGAEYDGVHLSVGAVDLAGRVCALTRRRVSTDASSLVRIALEEAIDTVLAEASLSRSDIVGLGLGLPGTFDPEGRILRFAPFVGVGEPRDFGPILDELSSHYGFPLILENDANAAALGEFAARGLGAGDDLLFVVLGRGLGSGLILDGRLRRGRRSFAGEIGYLVFDPSWKASLAAPGWLEETLDLGGFWQEEGRPEGPSEASLERVATWLSLGLAELCTALDLDRVVVGGLDRGGFGPLLLARIREALARLTVLTVSLEAPQAPEPGVSGAARLALDRWLGAVFAG